MRTKAQDYRARADKCDTAARQAAISATEMQFHELARCWRAMADYLERRPQRARPVASALRSATPAGRVNVSARHAGYQGPARAADVAGFIFTAPPSGTTFSMS